MFKKKIVNSCVYFFAFLLVVLSINLVSAQCITSYPYCQNFESGKGGWNDFGSNSDWQHGTPAKAIITGAGGGTKCWISGSLTGATYNNGEQAYVLSPCFDFSSLSYPSITFKVIWESEQKFDGAKLESSIDNGVTWLAVGSSASTTDCNTDNWYNTTAIKFLNSPTWIPNTQGWSGSTKPNSTSGGLTCLGGGGSGGWVVAKHCLTGLAGKPKVLLRFAFASGSACNTYDGFGFDDVCIQEGIANTADYTWQCAGTNTVKFTTLAQACPVATAWTWDFGEPSSGAANVSSAKNPTHNYSAPGTYTVKLTASGGACNPPGVITKTITVLDASIQSKTDVTCFGLSDGTAQTTITAGTAPYVYNWSGGAGATSSVSGLLQGIYTVTVTDASSCSITKTVSISQPTALLIDNVITEDEYCGGSDGTATVSVGGGIAPYKYTWSSGGSAASEINLTANNYTITITDDKGCGVTNVVTVNAVTSITADAGNDKVICAGQNIQLLASGGKTYTWTPAATLNSANIANPTASPTSNTTYVVNVTSGACVSTDAVLISVSPAPVVTASGSDSILAGANTLLTATGIGTFQWGPAASLNNSSSSNPIASPIITTTYTVTITDVNGCTSSDVVTVYVSECESVFLPTAFSPNNDGQNDVLYVRGKCVNTFTLKIFDRWGAC